jgi:hypothetical protein
VQSLWETVPAQKNSSTSYSIWLWNWTKIFLFYVWTESSPEIHSYKPFGSGAWYWEKSSRVQCTITVW